MADPAAEQQEPPAAAPHAHVVHQTGRRMRLKIPARRHDGAFFERLEQRLATIPKIEASLLTPETASVLLTFAEGEGDGVVAALDALELISVVKKQPERALADTRAADTKADNAKAANAKAANEGAAHEGAAENGAPASVQAPTAAGGIDRRALAFTVLVLLLLRQLLRGGWLAPGLALLWFLFELLRTRFPEGAPMAETMTGTMAGTTAGSGDAPNS